MIVPLFRRFLLGMLLLISLGVEAHSVGSSYEVSVPCHSQEDQERQALFREGMQEVLNRIRPQGTLEEYRSNILENALERAVDYVERYAYEGENLYIRYHPGRLRELLVTLTPEKNSQSLRAFLVSVRHVRSYQDFAKIERHIKRAQGVRHVSVVEIKGDRVIFQVVSSQAINEGTALSALSDREWDVQYLGES